MKSIKEISIKVKRHKLMEERAPYNVNITSPEEVANMAQSVLDGVDQEVFLVFPVDTRSRVIGYTEVSRGGVDRCMVDPREVFRAAIVMGATSLFLVHNHPSGDSSPSPEDKKLTKRFSNAGQLLGIPVVDHLIVCDDEYTSFATEYATWLETEEEE